MIKRTVVFMFAFILAAQSAWASPSGLNNIPTTDVAPDRTLVIQGWITAGDKAKPLYMTGAKYGVFDRIELGVDSTWGPPMPGR